MKKTLTIILLSILALSMLLCGCDTNSQKEEKDEIIKKAEIRQEGDSLTVVYEDGYERSYLLTQPIEAFVENDGTRSARAIGLSFLYYTISGGSTSVVPGNAIITGTGNYFVGGDGSDDYTISGDGFIGSTSDVQMQATTLYFEQDGKKYENCSSELLTIFRANTTLIDFATGYEKESFDCIYASGFTKFEKLEAVILPTSVKKVGKNAFDGCTKLTTVYYHGTAQEWARVELVETEVEAKDDKEKVEITENLLAACTVYYYSEQAPTDAGNYWHLVNGKPVVW